MKIGIELPTTLPNITVPLIRDWARYADAGPFSSIGIIDRLVYNSFDPLITLASVATETQRIRLMTGVLLAPCIPELNQLHLLAEVVSNES